MIWLDEVVVRSPSVYFYFPYINNNFIYIRCKVRPNKGHENSVTIQLS